MNIHPLGYITTPFSEKFAIPRQAHIVTEAYGTLQFCDKYRQADSLDGLTAHSHYWLIWGFHINEKKEKTLTVRPPRLGGNKRVGVFSTRSPFRPNNLGLSVVKLVSLDADKKTVTFSGVDMLSGSPIYDIKPYIPYADCRQEATSEWANYRPEAAFKVEFLPAAADALQNDEQRYQRGLRGLITALLAYDPRPAYKNGQLDNKVYATQLYDMDIAWRIDDNIVTVISATLKN
ncbi:MAG: tRNA (N6-threonylcarbamoyladenosine(37)-N6)-methyltransferase TrmO [Gammaproteobacteria bacterium]|nr:MAG: tRNA (N6-threonylcarbamoyladenosine(37)-N6)-methyltransferase TrmO [Gammaproteobacteria bacterium]